MKSKYPVDLLKKYITQIRGISYRADDVQNASTDGYVPILRANNISDSKLNFEDLVYVKQERVRDVQYIRTGDIIVAASSGSKEIVGKAAQISHDYPGALGAFCKLIRPKQGINERYLGYYFSSPHYRRTMANFSSGANIKNLRNVHIDNLQIPIPPFDTQKKIAAVLDKAQEMIDKRKTQIEKLDQFVVNSFIKIAGPMAEDYKLWKHHEISNLVLSGTSRLRSGPFGSNLLHSEFVSDGICVLGIDNVVLNRFSWKKRRFITAEKYEKLRKYTVYPEDVLITMMGTIGRSAVVPKGIPTAISTKHLAVLTLDKEKANPCFVSFCIHSHPFVLQQISVNNSGAIMDGLNLKKIKSIKIPLPPLDIQNKFAQILERSEQQKELMHKNLTEMQINFNNLMQRAFQGELF